VTTFSASDPPAGAFRAADTQERQRREAAWTVCGGVLLGTSTFSLSLTGLLARLSPASVVVCLALGVAAAVVCARRLDAAMPRAVWLLLPLCVPLVLAALALPPHTWDDVAYGAALPRDYARAGRFFYNADYGPYSAFPSNYETLVTASLLLTRGVAASQALNVLAALALALMAFQLARSLGASMVPSGVFAWLVLCAPALIENTPLTKNDVVNALFQALAVLVLAANLGGSTVLRPVLSGAFLGLALGTKYSSLHFAAALAPFALVLLWAGGHGRRWKSLGLWATSLALFAAPWYARNVTLFGNPVYPFANELLGARNGFTAAQSVLLHESFDGLAGFSLATASPTVLLSRIGRGFGVLPAVLALPGALVALRSGSGRGLLVAGTAITYATLTLLIGYWEPRYFLSLLVLAAALAALALERAWSAELPVGLRRLAGPAVLALLAAAAIAAAAPLWRSQLRDVAEVWRFGRETFMTRHVAYYRVARWLNEHMRAEERVAIGFNVQPFYYLERPYYHIHPLTEGPLVTVRTPQQLATALHEIGADLLAFSPSDGTYSPGTAPEICAYEQRLWHAQRQLRKAGALKLVAVVSGVRILAVERPSAADRQQDEIAGHAESP
jgi:hypothetical protein